MTGKISPKLRFLAPAVLVAFVAACAATRANPYGEYIRTWIGARAERLARVWGPPQHTAPLSEGASLIEYRERYVNRVAAPVTGGTGVRLENRVSWCITRFTVKNGIVQAANFEGADCRAP